MSTESSNGNLLRAFSELQEHHRQSGFVRDQLDSVQRYVFCHPEFSSRCLRVQYNPARALRFSGNGTQVPPQGMEVKHDGCFLCRENIRWQQRGTQLGYQLEINSHSYIAWMNPFPLLPGHLVVATADHVSQEWHLHPNGKLPVKRIIGDLTSLSARMPGYAGFYNGVDAGASIPDHMHYQFFQPPQEHRHFPLELEAIEARAAQPALGSWRLGRYPLETMHWHGPAGDTAEAASEWASIWAEHQTDLTQVTANIIAINDENSDLLSLFFVPRSRGRCRASCMSGLVGGLEVLGEMVFSSGEEKALLDSGRITYFDLEQVLAEVCTPLNMP